MSLPSAEDYPDYYQIIKTPLALDDISVSFDVPFLPSFHLWGLTPLLLPRQANLEAGEYSNVAQVRAALEHCFWNAKKCQSCRAPSFPSSHTIRSC